MYEYEMVKQIIWNIFIDNTISQDWSTNSRC